jgi:pyruvate formate lyase activating enzyme
MDTDEYTSIVFTITRGSFVDGWGIRTTIFLKGCPLRCIWCCNPESQSPLPELCVTPAECTHCGLCRDVYEYLKLESDGPTVDRRLCTNCGKCAELCPTKALTMFGEVYTVDRAFRELIRDKEYYDRSGGGVTIGGGEATFSDKFTYALVKKLQETGVHVAIDTCGYPVSPLALKVLEQADLLLFDLKGFDSERHRKHTGVSNELIHKTLRHLGALGKDIIIRIPLIPGHTDDNETLRNEAALIASIGTVRRIDLIPYHDFGAVKYRQLGRPYKMEGTPRLAEERVEEIARIFSVTGIPTQIGG